MTLCGRGMDVLWNHTICGQGQLVFEIIKLLHCTTSPVDAAHMKLHIVANLELHAPMHADLQLGFVNFFKFEIVQFVYLFYQRQYKIVIKGKLLWKRKALYVFRNIMATTRTVQC